jgi:hypothetical protein
MLSQAVAKRIEAKCREAQAKIEADVVPRKTQSTKPVLLLQLVVSLDKES